MYEDDGLVIVQDLDYFKDLALSLRWVKSLEGFEDGNDMVWLIIYKVTLLCLKQK